MKTLFNPTMLKDNVALPHELHIIIIITIVDARDTETMAIVIIIIIAMIAVDHAIIAQRGITIIEDTILNAVKAMNVNSASVQYVVHIIYQQQLDVHIFYDM